MQKGIEEIKKKLQGFRVEGFGGVEYALNDDSIEEVAEEIAALLNKVREECLLTNEEIRYCTTVNLPPMENPESYSPYCPDYVTLLKGEERDKAIAKAQDLKSYSIGFEDGYKKGRDEVNDDND